MKSVVCTNRESEIPDECEKCKKECCKVVRVDCLTTSSAREVKNHLPK